MNLNRPSVQRNVVVRKTPRRFNGVIFDSKSGLALTGTGAAFALDNTRAVAGNASLKVVTGAGNNAEIEISPACFNSQTGSYAFRVFIEDHTKVDVISLYLSNSSSYTNFRTVYYQITGIPSRQRNGWHYVRASDFSNAALLLTTGSVFNLAGTTIQRTKIRITPVAGQVATVYLDALYCDPSQSKAKFIITADDSYLSWYQNGVSYLNQVGLKSTLFNIASALGTGSGDGQYMSQSQVAAMYADGHDIAVHGAANLSTLADSAARYADIKANRDFLINNDMPRAANFYAWPNGVFETAADDMSLIHAAMSNGIIAARGTARAATNAGPSSFSTAVGGSIWRDGGYLAELFHLYNLPVLGHDGTVDVGASQLSGLLGRIDAVAQLRETAFLMFHKIGSSPVDALHCPESDFHAIVDRIKYWIDAGVAEAPTISQWWTTVSDDPRIGSGQ